jgi:group I intron endonuclease
MYGIIYQITNRETGKKYIGQTTVGIQKRWHSHVWAAYHRKTPQRYVLYKAIRKYGKDGFLVEQIDTAESLCELNQKETEWIARLGTFGNGYNMTEGGGGTVGLRKEKHGMWGKGSLVSGINNPMFGRTGKQHPMFGKHHSEATRSKMRASHNHISGTEHWSTGKQITEETRKKMSAASTGRKQSAETIEKRVSKFRGKLRGPVPFRPRKKKYNTEEERIAAVRAAKKRYKDRQNGKIS